MLIPSENLSNSLSEVSGGIFFETVNVGTEYAKVDMIAKLPTEIIKYIYFGTSVFFSIRLIHVRDCSALCTILVVEDDPKNMFYLSRTHGPEDIDLVVQFLNQDEIELHAFDELNRNVASFKGTVSVSDTIVKDLVQVKPIICNLTALEIKIILRDLAKKLAQNDVSALKLIQFEFKNCHTKPLSFYHYPPAADGPIYDPNRFKDPYEINNSNQGRQFEINLTRLLRKTFNYDSLFPSPFGAILDSKNREFIDLVAVLEDYLLFFEAKASAITLTSTQRNTERRVSNIEKQIRKAIRQLRGAYKKGINNGVLTLKTVSRTKEIRISHFSVHLIIIVSEVHPDLAKSNIIKEVISLGKELDVGVHVLDFQALNVYIRDSKDAKEFVTLLDHRWNLSLENKILIFNDEWFHT